MATSQDLPDQGLDPSTDLPTMNRAMILDVEPERRDDDITAPTYARRDLAQVNDNGQAPRPRETERNQAIPLWQRELAASRVGRHARSRASSIISCQTRMTMSTEDNRSVEFEAGGHSFRISRDGSSVTNVTAPPPYPGPPMELLVEENGEDEGDPLQSDPSSEMSGDISENINLHDDTRLVDLPIGTHSGAETIIEHEPGLTIQATAVLDIPQRLRSILPFRWTYSNTFSTQSKDNTVAKTSGLRRTLSDSSSLVNFRQLPSDVSTRDDPPNRIASGDAGSEPTMTSARENEDEDEEISQISRNYALMMRNLDRQQRQKLHERDTELNQLRQLLHEKDQVLRQQLREKDFIIGTLRREVDVKDKVIDELTVRAMENERLTQSRLEKARNEIEDVWERRWKEYEQLISNRSQQQSEVSAE